MDIKIKYKLEYMKKSLVECYELIERYEKLAAQIKRKIKEIEDDQNND